MGAPTRDAVRIPVWLFAPVGQDAKLLRSALPRGDGLRIARDAEHLAQGFREEDEVGVLVLTQEALTPRTVEVLTDHVERQPPWAELPIVLLVDGESNTMHALGLFQNALPRSKLLILQRPVRLSELETAVGTMRRSRRRQYDVKAYVERQERLRRELNHRVKNILATVQALYGLTARTAKDLDTFDAVFQPRLAAMARVHDVLFAANYGPAALYDLMAAVLAPYAGDERVGLEGPAILVPAEAGQSLALIVHELATNAAKHGALRSDAGQVSLTWSGGDTLSFAWSEAGGGPTAPPAAEGYGTTFINATVSAMGGEADFRFADGGLRFRAAMPMPEGEAEASLA